MENIYQETKFILKKYGIRANKNLGQNFLINQEVIDSIILGAKVSKEDLIIEIGPGLGTLTKSLLEKAGKVISIEIDNKMIRILEDRFKIYDNFELINEDILKVDLNKIIEENLKKLNLKMAKIVANLPYYITTPIIMKLLEERINVETITVMIQKEVAERIIAMPGTKLSGAITYSVYYYSESNKILEVMPNSFIPEPSVNSEVINIKLRKEKAIITTDEKLMFKIIKYAFMQRRKTFVNALSNSLNSFSKDEILKVLEKLKINTNIRGEELSLEDYSNITNELKIIHK